MKQLVIAIAIVMAMSVSVSAQEVPNKNDAAAKNFWQYVSSSENFHLLDNATSGAFYDFKSHAWYGGAISAVYSPGAGYASLDFGMIRSIEIQDSTFPVLALRIHGRKILAAKSARAAKWIENQPSLLRYTTIGAWGARDFDVSEWRYGYFIGAEVKF